MVLVPVWMMAVQGVLLLLTGAGLVREALERIGRRRHGDRRDAPDATRGRIDRIDAAVARTSSAMERDVDAIRANLGRLAERGDALGDALDELAAADKNRRSRLADLFGCAATEVLDLSPRLEDLSATFRLLSEDVYDPELDGDRDDADVDDHDDHDHDHDHDHDNDNDALDDIEFFDDLDDDDDF